jgi:primosomal protein N''
MSDDANLQDLVQELEQAATQLRSGELDSAEAADLIERCAELAARLGGELEALARKGEGGSPGQETLL